MCPYTYTHELITRAWLGRKASVVQSRVTVPRFSCTDTVRTSNTANGFLFGSLSRERSKMPSLVLISSNLAIADLQIYLGY